MKVIATKLGVWIPTLTRHRKGSIFDVPEGETAEWFEPYVEPKEPEPKRKTRASTLKEIQEAVPERTSGTHGRPSDKEVL